MTSVDEHSQICMIDAIIRASSRMSANRSSQFRDDDHIYRVTIQECNERIFKIIQTFLRKLENQNFFGSVLDNIDRLAESGSTGGLRGATNQTAIVEERSLIHAVIQSAN